MKVIFNMSLHWGLGKTHYVHVGTGSLSEFESKEAYRKSGKFRVENYSCCIFSCGEIFVIYCIDEIFTLSL